MRNHFDRSQLHAIKTKQIFEKHKVLVKYCELPHDNRKSWCRLTIQPKLSEQQFIKELL